MKKQIKNKNVFKKLIISGFVVIFAVSLGLGGYVYHQNNQKDLARRMYIDIQILSQDYAPYIINAKDGMDKVDVQSYPSLSEYDVYIIKNGLQMDIRIPKLPKKMGELIRHVHEGDKRPRVEVYRVSMVQEYEKKSAFTFRQQTCRNDRDCKAGYRCISNICLAPSFTFSPGSASTETTPIPTTTPPLECQPLERKVCIDGKCTCEEPTAEDLKKQKKYKSPTTDTYCPYIVMNGKNYTYDGTDGRGVELEDVGSWLEYLTLRQRKPDFDSKGCPNGQYTIYCPQAGEEGANGINWELSYSGGRASCVCPDNGIKYFVEGTGYQCCYTELDNNNECKEKCICSDGTEYNNVARKCCKVISENSCGYLKETAATEGYCDSSDGKCPTAAKECADGERCINDDCCLIENICGNDCCTGNETCDGGICVDNTTPAPVVCQEGETVCGTDCCEADESCIGNICEKVVPTNSPITTTPAPTPSNCTLTCSAESDGCCDGKIEESDGVTYHFEYCAENGCCPEEFLYSPTPTGSKNVCCNLLLEASLTTSLKNNVCCDKDEPAYTTLNGYKACCPENQLINIPNQTAKFQCCPADIEGKTVYIFNETQTTECSTCLSELSSISTETTIDESCQDVCCELCPANRVYIDNDNVPNCCPSGQVAYDSNNDGTKDACCDHELDENGDCSLVCEEHEVLIENECCLDDFEVSGYFIPGKIVVSNGVEKCCKSPYQVYGDEGSPKTDRVCCNLDDGETHYKDLNGKHKCCPTTRLVNVGGTIHSSQCCPEKQITVNGEVKNIVYYNDTEKVDECSECLRNVTGDENAEYCADSCCTVCPDDRTYLNGYSLDCCPEGQTAYDKDGDGTKDSCCTPGEDCPTGCTCTESEVQVENGTMLVRQCTPGGTEPCECGTYFCVCSDTIITTESGTMVVTSCQEPGTGVNGDYKMAKTSSTSTCAMCISGS